MLACLSKAATRLKLTRLLSTTTTTKPPLVNITIDGKKIQAVAGSPLIEAIRKEGLDVPAMCYHQDLKGAGGICRICAVEDLSRPGAPPLLSCFTPVVEGMNISTASPNLHNIRQTNIALMFRSHPVSCMIYPSNTKCEVQNKACEANIDTEEYEGIMDRKPTNTTRDKSTVVNLNMSCCISCDRCIQACRTQCNVFEWGNEGFHKIETFGPMHSNECIQCGQCINQCPTGALTEGPEMDQVLKVLNDPDKHVVFQIAPSIRASIGEEFGLKPGEKVVKNELVTALKSLGKNVTVFDTNFSADLTIVEEASELVERITRRLVGKKHFSQAEKIETDLPMFTSCCPSWVTFVEKAYPDMLSHMSSCKSPMQMLSVMTKTYWAEKVKGIDPKKIVTVAIMPCTSKKDDKEQPEMRTKYYKWTDYVWTTREFATVMKRKGIDPTKLPKTEFDKALGMSSGGGALFATTGGLLEAALRTAYETITGRPLPFDHINVKPLRGMEGVRESKLKFENVKPEFAELEGVECRVAVAHQIMNARKVLDKVKEAKAKGEDPPWHFVEVMACPGGCLGGGGQPKPTSTDVRVARANLIYHEDRDLPIRKCHENPEIKELYKNFLKHPLSETSHHLLHRHYTPFTGQHARVYDPKEAHGIEDILKKYKKGLAENILPIILEETDKKGYLSGASIAKIAAHTGVNPVRVTAVASHYHYFPLMKKPADTRVYLCTCHNCTMHGQGDNYKKLTEIAKQDKNIEVHNINWLGICVNDAPSALVKRTGTDYVEYLMGLNERNIEKKVKNIPESAVKTPPNKIKTRLFQPGFEHSSMLEPLPEALIDKAVSFGLRGNGDAVIEKLMKAKLEGRGGAGFPTFRKWDSVRKSNAETKYLICNADEGLPSMFKDWWILNNENARTRMVSGMAICAKLIGTKKAYIYLRYEYRNLLSDLQKTISEVKQKHPEVEDVEFIIRIGGGPYIAGEETALFESLQGETPVPRKNRPWNVFATVQGLFYAPTVINNVETFFAVPYILHHKEENIEKAGLPKLFSIAGDISQPVLAEYALYGKEKLTLNKILKDISATDIIAAEIGGATEPLAMKNDFDKPIGFGRGVYNAGGSVVLFKEGRDISDVYMRKLDFMVDESCKQCVPCREGAPIFREQIRKLLKGEEISTQEEVLKKIAKAAAMTSICAHGKALEPLFEDTYKFANTKQ